MNEIDLRKIDLNLLVVFQVLMAECSVSRAAERLGRTQSTVSHSLSRLREQLGDPLLVKAGGTMKPSPYALELIEQVRPILRSIGRVLAPKTAFAPATSERVFRLAAPDFALSFFTQLLASIQAQAPGVSVDWAGPQNHMLLDLAEGQLDLAITPAHLKLPEGLDAENIGTLHWRCYMRKDHPALSRWGKAAWAKWPHVVVRVGNRLQNPVSTAAGSAGVVRRIAAWVPNFSAVAPLLARSDLIATLPTIVMTDAMHDFGLVSVAAPVAPEPMPHVMLWSTRLRNDPEIIWLRDQLRPAIRDALGRSKSG